MVMSEGRMNSGLNSPRSPFDFIINHLSATEKSVVDCCSVLPNRLRLRKLHDFVSVFLQQGFQQDQSTSVEVDLYLRVENVRLLERFYHWQNRSLNESSLPAAGTLYLTPTHLIFVNPVEKRESWILLGHIGAVDRSSIIPAGCPLVIRCKTFLSVTFLIAKDRDCHEVYSALLRLSQPSVYEELYCFSYNPGDEAFDRSSGWNMFDLQTEYHRQGVPNQNWSLSKLNQNYEICDSYPHNLYVPAVASQKLLLGSSGFRSRGRLPVLTYLHPKTKAAICRSSQPLSGFKARCEEDEQMLVCILKATPSSKTVYIVDTRPKINAMANRATGKGYETEQNYVGMKVHFFTIENIHVMRGSLGKLGDVCDLKAGVEDLNVPSHSIFLDGLQNTSWLKHIRAILEASVFVADKICEGSSVLVHCSDGWDRTSQTCALACLLLDPYYRTLHGFMALIEKDWLAFGHKFSERAGHLRPFQTASGNSPALTPSSAVNAIVSDFSKEQSPVFLQFLDCVWQLLAQKPHLFQFNERFLLTLHDHLHSCQFGTFIGNNEKERKEMRLSEQTFSLWEFMKRRLTEYVNPLYDTDKSRQTPVIQPDLSPQNIRLWVMMYNRFEEGIHPREPLSASLQTLKDHSTALEDHVVLLERRIQLLKEAYKQNALRAVATPTFDMNGIGTRGSFESNESVPELTKAPVIVDSVALDWKATRDVAFCVCSTPFSQFSVKYHCWRCGDVVCRRCTENHASLDGLFSKKPVPVCQQCNDSIRSANKKKAVVIQKIQGVNHMPK